MKKTAQDNELYRVADHLKFGPHRISVDPTGRYNEPMDRSFPFFIRLFHFHHRNFTSAPSWHERLELFIPLDGPLRMRMGNEVAALEAGEILIVDNLKLHMVADTPAPNTRVIVISFLPEFVCDGGPRSLDHVFLLPFYTRLAEEIHVVRNGEVAKKVGFSDQSYFDRRFKTPLNKPHGSFALNRIATFRFHSNRPDRSNLRTDHAIQIAERSMKPPTRNIGTT